MERDDLIVNDSYSLAAHHDEEHGKKLRKKIVFVTILLTAITAVEVAFGVFVKQNSDMWPFVKILFIVLTVFKAAYIVMSFMHLGDESKNLKYTILMPYGLFVLYLIFILLQEGTYTSIMDTLFH